MGALFNPVIGLIPRVPQINQGRAVIERGIATANQLLTALSPVSRVPGRIRSRASKFMPLNFIANMRNSGGDLDRQHRFDVVINIPRLVSNLSRAVYGTAFFDVLMNSNLSNSLSTRFKTFINNSQLPGMTLGFDELHIYGPTFKMPNITSFGDVDMRFYCGSDMEEKKFFDAWMYSINDPYTNDFEYLVNYSTEIYITKYDALHNVVYQVRLLDAYPISVNQLDLDWNGSENISELVVTFTYKRYIPTILEFSNTTGAPLRGGFEDFDSTVTGPPVQP